MTPDLQRPIAAVVILAIVAGVYARGLDTPFIFDDHPSITSNPQIRSLWPLPAALSAPDETAAAGRPVVCLTLAVNYAIGGLNPKGYHVFNIAVHLLCTLLLAWLITRTLRQPCFQNSFDRIAEPLGWLGAFIWAMHPIQTEAVNYVIQRTELLAALFCFSTLYAAIKSWDYPEQPWWKVLAVLACTLGMGSKELVAVLPPLILLYDRTFVAGDFKAALRRRPKLYAGLAATWLLLAALVISGPRDNSVGSLEGVTPLNYLQTQAGVLLWYLRLMVWPSGQTICYDWPIAESIADWLLPGCVVLAMLGVTLWGIAKRSWAGFVGAWCFLILAPTSSFLPMTYEFVAERRMYLPSAVLVPAVVAALYRVASFVPRRGVHAATALSFAAAAILVTTTYTRLGDYQSEHSIWSDALAKGPGSYLVQHNYAHMLQQQGKFEEAIGHYDQALDLRPHYHKSRLNRANCHAKLGDVDAAIADYRAILDADPRYAPAHNNLGIHLFKRGQYKQAADHFVSALEAQPVYPDAHVNLAQTLLKFGQTEAAFQQIGHALAIQPDHPHALSMLRTLQAAVTQPPPTQAAVPTGP